MKFRSISYVFIVVAAGAVVSLLGLVWALRAQPWSAEGNTPIIVQAQRPPGQATTAFTAPFSPQVMVGEPEEYDPPVAPARYTYRNEFSEDTSKPRSLYVIDTQTGQEIRLGDDTGAGVYSAQNEHFLLWHFICVHPCRTFEQGLYAYSFATQESRFVSAVSTPIIHPLLADNWAAFGRDEPRSPQATLYAANLQTHEIITLTHELSTQIAVGNGHFGISSQLAAWYTFSYPDPPAIVVYDLTTHTEVVRLTDFSTAFNEPAMTVTSLMAGETIVTWSLNYGYDLVTKSYFRIEAIKPPHWGQEPSFFVSPMREEDRMLYWTFHMQDGTQRHVRAPLIDATPSAMPCVEGQNLVQNGDLEDIAQHALWSQSGNQSNLLVDDPPPGAPGGGAWAIRLGRYRNATHEMRQLIAIPSGVKALTLHFDVQVGTWDRWGGDWLAIDLLDPLSGQSYLVMPVRWRNTQLLSPGWLPVAVQIEGWPAVDAPVYLVFRGLTDWAIPTDFTLDNIRLVTACR